MKKVLLIIAVAISTAFLTLKFVASPSHSVKTIFPADGRNTG